MQAFLLLALGLVTGPAIDVGYMLHILFVGTLIVVLDLVFTSMCHNYWQFMLAQGIMVGLGSGCLFLPSVTVVPQYFTKNRSLALGVVAVGSSAGMHIRPVHKHASQCFI